MYGLGQGRGRIAGLKYAHQNMLYDVMGGFENSKKQDQDKWANSCHYDTLMYCTVQCIGWD